MLAEPLYYYRIHIQEGESYSCCKWPCSDFKGFSLPIKKPLSGQNEKVFPVEGKKFNITIYKCFLNI